MSVEEFKHSREKILAGRFYEFERCQNTYALTIEQYNALAEAHEFITKQNDNR